MPVGEITRIAGMAGLKQPSGAEVAPRAFRCARRRHRGTRWAPPRGRMGGGTAHLSRPDDGRLSQSLRDHRPRIALGAHQHGGLDRIARRLGRGLHRGPERAWPDADRGDARRPGRLGRPRERDRAPDPLPPRKLLVHGSQHSRQAARVHSLRRQRRGLSQNLQFRGGRRLPGIPAGVTSPGPPFDNRARAP